MALVPMVVHHVQGLLASYVSTEELSAFAHDGVWSAARSFDPARGTSFRRWASMKIRGAVIDGLRTQSDLPRRLYRRLRTIESTTWAHEGTPLAEGDASEAAQAADERLGWQLEAMATALAMGTLMQRSPQTLNALSDDRDDPEEELAREELKAAVRAAIAQRPETERNLLQRYYFEGVTMEEAAGGLSKSWASRLHARALREVARTLKGTQV